MDHIMLSFPVGIRQRNLKDDVRVVQALLNKKCRTCDKKLVVDGIVGPKTIERIKAFQATQLYFSHPDGIISPLGKTLRALHYIVHPVMPIPKFHASATNKIPEENYINAAHCLNCEVAVVKAIALTESQHSPFLSPGRPFILFEKHYFGFLTKHRYDSSYPDISGTTPYQQYGSYHKQYERLNEAIKLDRKAALESASWGMFQIMGESYKEAGFGDIESFVKAMGNIDGQFFAFINFVKSKPGLLSALRSKSWGAVARIYNGPKYRKNHYDGKLANNYQKALHCYVA